jgi:aerotaxis receptor
MRHNPPVTRQAGELADGVTSMPTTDTESCITYANDAFVAASGFTRA